MFCFLILPGLCKFQPADVRFALYMMIGSLGMLAACGPPPPPPITWHTLTSTDGQYAIDLPDDLQAGYDMHEYANLQYYNLEKSIFLLGIEDAKDNLGDIKRKRLKIGGYFAFVEDVVLEKTDTSFCESIEHFVPTGPNSHDARVGDYYVASPSMGPAPIYYRIAVFESEELFLQLVIWMPYEQHCEIRPMVDRITRSVTFL